MLRNKSKKTYVEKKKEIEEDSFSKLLAETDFKELFLDGIEQIKIANNEFFNWDNFKNHLTLEFIIDLIYNCLHS